MSCNCKISNPSGCVKCLKSDKELQDFALALVINSTNCDANFVKNNVPIWWKLFESQSCGSRDLRTYLLARQIATSLMAIYARQVDTSSMMRIRNNRGAGWSKNEGWMRAQATSSGIRFSDALNKSEYNDFLDSQMNSASNRGRSASNSANSGSSANSFSRGGSTSDSYRRSNGEGARRDNSSFNRNTQGAGKSESHGDAQGNQGNFFSGFGFIGLGQTSTSGFVGGQGQNNSFGVNARNDTQNSFGTVSGFTQSVGSSGMLSSSFGVGGSNSNASGASGSQMNDDGSAHRDSVSHGEGLGTGQGGSNSQSRNSSQGSSDSEGTGHTEFSAHGSGVVIADSVMANQRLKHLADIVKNMSAQIKELRKYKGANALGMRVSGRGVCACVEVERICRTCNTCNTGSKFNE